jgi:putative lipoic acid-binding regulatory protein
MQPTITQFEKFKELLNREHSWPERFIFKFIVKKTELEYARTLFIRENLEVRESESGKYVSLTLVKMMQSSEDVMAVYKKASVIPGLIAL